MKIKYFFGISSVISLLFLAISICIYKSLDVELYFEKALTLTFSFIGSVGTIASIAFAIWLYNSQRESQQPVFFIADDLLLKDSQNSTERDSFSFLYLSITNYGHEATSFSMTLKENLGSNDINIGIFGDMKPSFKKGETHTIQINIQNTYQTDKTPEPSHIDFIVSLNYLDMFNSTHFDHYRVFSVNGSRNIKMKKC
ncbi:hypothetical protein [Acinetobacter equi]|uniref:Uncharacterized protein n=1 Tax=Acinetobacter equi TaxID=1324350 RepID=A0A0N9VQM0_9GAMM|nr:hypothetical protein [Acinetobacter equi]ALH95676.1 hypothetical protein AOY20_09110 [Acinetobacter equi]